MEPEIRKLYFIKYTDSEGNDKEFRLTKMVQNHWRELGTLLGIDKATLDGFDSSLTRKDKCEKIFDLWIMKGEGEYSVTWAGLLQALKDAELGGVAEHLREALTFIN